jgi:hypothetical protein
MKYQEEHMRRVALLERMAERGIESAELLSEVSRDRLMIMDYLRQEHGSIRYSPRSLYKMPSPLKQTARNFMYEKLGDSVRAKGRINEALSKPKKSSRISKEPEFGMTENDSTFS